MKSVRWHHALLAVVALPFVVSGCADDGTVLDNVTSLKAGGAVSAYVLNEAGQSTLLQFTLANGGAVSPTATLALPSTFSGSSAAVDPSNGTIYVGGVDTTALTSEVLVYAAGSAGVASPTATILPANSDFAEPLAMAVDSTGKLYVASIIPGTAGANDTATVAVLAAGSTGAAAPVRTIAGSATGLFQPTGITVDASGTLYVSNVDSASTPYSGVISIFSSSANGNASPTKVITNVNQVFNGVAVDAQGNVYAVAENLTVTNNVNTYSSPKIVKFTSTASGAATPSNTISGSSTGMQTVGKIQVDTAGNIYVVNESGTGSTAALLGFAPAASGNQAPALNLTSTALTAGSAEFALK